MYRSDLALVAAFFGLARYRYYSFNSRTLKKLEFLWDRCYCEKVSNSTLSVVAMYLNYIFLNFCKILTLDSLSYLGFRHTSAKNLQMQQPV
jgi:hypothetical protein